MFPSALHCLAEAQGEGSAGLRAKARSQTLALGRPRVTGKEGSRASGGASGAIFPSFSLWPHVLLMAALLCP